ncbi:MAG: hypothetical protein Q4E69_04480 [Bacilli bacterium]|nr:hypothetical protein [Bacilli bacterium]
MENNKTDKKMKTNPNGFYERITDSRGLDIDGLLTAEEKEKLFQELMLKTIATYSSIQKSKVK